MTPTIVHARHPARLALAFALLMPLAIAASEPGKPGITDEQLAALPEASLPAGAFPYFGVPDGYVSAALHVRELDFGQVALWTGEAYRMVEGRVYSAGIRPDRASGKQFSGPEVSGNLAKLITDSGGVLVFSGIVPREMARDESANQTMRAYHVESLCRGNSPIQVYALRRNDGLTWVRTCVAQNFAGLIVVDAQPLQVTANLLPAAQMREQLDTEGRVALQVHFATDSAQILPESQPQIDQVLALLTDDPALTLAINGHTDSTGDADHNLRLSDARAAAVVAALTAKGIAASRLQSAGRGAGEPVADNTTEEGRARNRRVELVKS